MIRENEKGIVMFYILVISVIVVIVILALSVAAISKGYQYKHSVDPLPKDNHQEPSQHEKS